MDGPAIVLPHLDQEKAADAFRGNQVEGNAQVRVKVHLAAT